MDDHCLPNFTYLNRVELYLKAVLSWNKCISSSKVSFIVYVRTNLPSCFHYSLLSLGRDEAQMAHSVTDTDIDDKHITSLLARPFASRISRH